MCVPAVVTSRGGSPEAVDEGITGWSVDVLEPQALAERVIAVLDSNSWRAAARARGPLFVRERFGLERMLDETLDCYGISAGDARYGWGP